MADFYATYPASDASISGSVSVTQGTSPWIVAGGGTAGTPATGVVTVQGIASGTAVATTQSRAIANAPVTVDYTSGGGVTTAAYVQLVASTTTAMTRLYIQDTSGSSMILATGAAASEVPFMYYGPGFASFMDFAIPAGSRIAIKALDTNAATGRLVASFFT